MNTTDGEYRYTPPRNAWPCPDHPGFIIRRCEHWSCNHTFHVPNRPGQPRRFCSTRCRVAEHRSYMT